MQHRGAVSCFVAVLGCVQSSPPPSADDGIDHDTDGDSTDADGDSDSDSSADSDSNSDFCPSTDWGPDHCDCEHYCSACTSGGCDCGCLFEDVLREEWARAYVQCLTERCDARAECAILATERAPPAVDAPPLAEECGAVCSPESCRIFDAVADSYAPDLAVCVAQPDCPALQACASKYFMCGPLP